MDVFLDVQATKDAVIRNSIAIFQYIYHASGTSLATIQYNMFLRKAAAGVIKPEILPPTEGSAAQHSPRVYLQTRDWMLLHSMSLDPSDYRWMVGIQGYEPVPTLEPMAPEELLEFTSCNCSCSNRRCSVGRTMSNASPRVETAKALRAKIALMTKSLEKTQTSINEAG